MSQTDSFVDEVNEELRRDRLFATLRRWGPVALALVVLLVGFAAWNEYRASQARAQAQAAGDAIYAALDSADAAARAQALAGLSDGDPIRGLLEAAAFQEAGETEQALAALARLAASDAPARITDLAALKAQMIAPDRDGLAALAQPGRPYRMLAAEQLVLLDLTEGQGEAALAGARAILEDADLTPGLRDRMETLIVSMDGTLTAE